ncbi:MAG TPA: AMP-binding protein [Methylomirabilota bacterium]
MGDNRPEWLYCHLGIQTAGGVTVGVYPTSAPEQIRYLLDHSEARLIFVENEEQLDKLLTIVGDTRIERVVVWDAKGLWGYADERVTFFEDFLKQGLAFAEREPTAVARRRGAVAAADTAMIIYTSGTTGPPKGAMLSHHSTGLRPSPLWGMGGSSEPCPERVTATGEPCGRTRGPRAPSPASPDSTRVIRWRSCCSMG